MNHPEFSKIYKDNYPKVIRLCMGYTNGNESEAKDLTQDVFIKVWNNIENFRNQSNLSTWIYRITVNTCLMRIRKQNKMKLSYKLPVNIENTADSSVQSKETRFNKLYNCIDKLSESNKTIILLELEGIKQKEIAEIIGIKYEAVRVRLHRIKSELTKCVRK